MQTKSQKNFQRSGEEYYKKVVSSFGREILVESDFEIDRKKLASMVFNDRLKKEILDKLTIEVIAPKIKEEAINISKRKLCIIDAPLLFETGLDEFCDMTIGIVANEETCIKRICRRDNMEEKDAKLRLQAQKSLNFFKEKCDYIINNEDGDIVEKQINEIFNGNNLSNENMVHLYDGEIEYLQFRDFIKYSDKIQHCYTLKPLDFKIGQMQTVLDNYQRICKSLNLDNKDIYRPKQTHSVNIMKVEDEEPGIHKFEEIDGLITNKRNKILSLVYADCTPIYFYDPVKNVIRKYTFRLERDL